MIIRMTSILQKEIHLQKNFKNLIITPTLWHQKCGKFFLKISKTNQTYDKKIFFPKISHASLNKWQILSKENSLLVTVV